MAFPFGSRTVGVLVRVIDQVYTDTHIGTLLLEAGAEPWAPQQWPNKQTRLQRLFAQMREDTGADVEPVALELVRLLLRKGSPSAERASPSVWWSEVLDAVAADGWEYDVDNERLVPTIPGVRVAEETTRIEAELNRRGWSTAAGHYRQALDAFTAGKWASANGQLRNLVEELLLTAAESVSGSRPKEVQAALDALRKAKVLVEGEYGLVKGLWELCQPRGSHLGLSDEEEARFRLMTVTAYCRFLLARLPGMDR